MILPFILIKPFPAKHGNEHPAKNFMNVYQRNIELKIVPSNSLTNKFCRCSNGRHFILLTKLQRRTRCTAIEKFSKRLIRKWYILKHVYTKVDQYICIFLDYTPNYLNINIALVNNYSSVHSDKFWVSCIILKNSEFRVLINQHFFGVKNITKV